MHVTALKPFRDISNYTNNGKPNTSPSKIKGLPAFLDSSPKSNDISVKPTSSVPTNHQLASDLQTFEKHFDQSIKQIMRTIERYEFALHNLQGNDIESGFNELLALAKDNWPKAQYALGILYEEGQIIEQDLDQAQMWYEKAVSKNFANAFNALGCFYLNDAYPQHNYQRAMELFQQLVEVRGDLTAMTHIGHIYHYGLGVETNFAKAMDFYKKAGQLGHLSAWQDIELLIKTIITSAFDDWEQQNYLQAQSKFELLSQENHKQAILVNIVLQDNEIRYSTKIRLINALIPILRSGDEGAQEIFYGYLYLKGYVFEKNAVEAERHFKKAAALGVAHAYTYLAHIYRSKKNEFAKYTQLASVGGVDSKDAANSVNLKKIALRRETLLSSSGSKQNSA